MRGQRNLNFGVPSGRDRNHWQGEPSHIGGRIEDFAGEILATAAAIAAAGVIAKLRERARATGSGLANRSIGNGIANANVHGGFRKRTRAFKCKCE